LNCGLPKDFIKESVKLKLEEVTKANVPALGFYRQAAGKQSINLCTARTTDGLWKKADMSKMKLKCH
jgi:hypothetical protein